MIDLKKILTKKAAVNILQKIVSKLLNNINVSVLTLRD